MFQQAPVPAPGGLGQPPEALQAAQKGKAPCSFAAAPCRRASCRPRPRCSRCIRRTVAVRPHAHPCGACFSAPDSHPLVATSLVLGVCFWEARSLKVALCVPSVCPRPWALHRLALLAQPSQSRCLPSAAGWMVWCRSALVLMVVGASATFVALSQGGCSAVFARKGARVGSGPHHRAAAPAGLAAVPAGACQHLHPGAQRHGQLDLALHPTVRGAGPHPHFSGRQVGLKGGLELHIFWSKVSPGVCFTDQRMAAHTSSFVRP